MSQASSLATRVMFRSRVVVFLSLTCLLTGELGCASARLKSIWTSVPEVRWTNREREQKLPPAAAPPAAEPAVAANVAIQLEANQDSSTETAADNRRKQPKSPFARSGRLTGRLDSRLFEDQELADSNDSMGFGSATFTDLENSESSIQRLDAALSDDALQEQDLLQSSLTTLDTRARVELLLSRAKQLLEIGQLESACQTALSAQELVEAAKIDYAPDEERPIDFVRRIEGQLEAVRQTDEPKTVETASTDAAPNTVSSTAKAPAADPNSAKDPSGLARIRRDWSTMFRREKKSSPKEDNSVGRETRLGKPSPVIENLKEHPQNVRTADARLNEPVVMANRSVSLGTRESVTVSSATMDADAPEPIVGKSSPSLPDSIRPYDPNASESLNGDDDSYSSMAESERSLSDNDERIVVPPEFDVVDPVVPNSRMELTEELPSEPVIASEDTSRDADWTTLYFVIAGCTFLAIGCYRRGAT